MKGRTLKEIADIALADVVIEDRLRPVDEAALEFLLKSAEEAGFTEDPIDVRRVRRGGTYRLILIDGRHRLELARRMDRATIKACIWDCGSLDARMMEIERNLVRAEMKPVDTSVFLRAYQQAYEEKYPEAKGATGAELAHKRWDANDKMSPVSFTAKVAELRGENQRTIQRNIAATAGLTDAEIEIIRGSAEWVSYTAMAQLGRLADTEERSAVCKMLANGEAKNVKAALKARSGTKPSLKSPVEEAFKDLSKAWKRAPAAARREFVGAFGNELAELLNQTPVVETSDNVTRLHG